MSGHGAPDNDVSSIRAQGLDIRVAIVAASWHTEVMNGLIEGALRAASDAGLGPKLIRVPGTFRAVRSCRAAGTALRRRRGPRRRHPRRNPAL